MRIPTISNDQAVVAWNSMQDHDSFDVSEMVLDYVGSDVDEETLSDLELIELCDELLAIMSRYQGKNKKNYGGFIDAEIVEPIHATLKDHANPYQLSQLGFWRWLSNVASNGAFWKFIKWRFDSDKQINWGITSPGSIIEVYFYRAWLRGQKMYDQAQPDPYHYAKIGSSDVWRSHILRQDFGRDREFVKALLDTIYDKSGQTLVGTEELRKKLVPALRAWTSGSTFAHLSYSENVELIRKLKNEGI